MIEELLTKVKQNLILEHSVDDELLIQFITAAISYAESYQHIEEGYYQENAMSETTKQTILVYRELKRKTLLKSSNVL